ncbi:Alpha/Beta hydrolase fold [Cinara cedri]|uniref:Alpha/Beta hydrolase fold n=1 Tax=Cinara cedri TaxID=506608 RepID=A0A5E4MSK7_9HEMI|nr:Alpha/Beta hydrolase fold [Cinara cedri]
MIHCYNDEKLSEEVCKTRDELFKEESTRNTIAYCGTRSFSDLTTDVNICQPLLRFLVDEHGKVYGRVHRGFYNVLQDSFDELESDLEHYAKA